MGFSELPFFRAVWEKYMAFLQFRGSLGHFQVLKTAYSRFLVWVCDAVCVATWIGVLFGIWHGLGLIL